MQKLERKKQYKAAPPMETVEKIRKILSDNGITVEEQLFKNDDAGVFSCNIYISNPEFKGVKIGTNGKGMTEEYSLASGYAEFMERLQNGIMFGLDAAAKIGTYDMPAKNCKDILRTFFTSNFSEDETASEYFSSLDRSYRIAEFTSVDDSEKTKVPMELLLKLTTSNGMCAGNNYLEAVIQGSSEIIERYAQKKIIMEKLCPPVIDDEYFRDFDVYNKLKLLSKNGVYYEIRDCSLGMGLPVIGIYMRLEDGRELFHLGADPSPVTSLERCITEIFQGVDSINDAEFHEKEEGDNDELFWKYQMLLCSWGGNVYPKELSSGCSSWEFTGFDHPVSESNEDDLNYYCEVLKKAGKKIYVKDVSYLGFPSYMCYIPGMSPLDFSFDNAEELVSYFEYNEQLKNIINLPKLGKKQLRIFGEKLSEYLYDFEYYEQDQLVSRMYPYGSFPGKEKDYYLHLVSIYEASGLYEEAAQSLENYMFSNELTDEDEEECFNHSVRLRQGKSRTRGLTDEEYPVCFECGKCKLKKYCIKETVDGLVARLESKSRLK